MNNSNNKRNYERADSVTVGVVTHQGSYHFLPNFLKLLSVAIQSYQEWANEPVEFILVNNSGVKHRSKIESIISQENIVNVCDCKLLDSPHNNIATGRNIVLSNRSYRLLAFIDDDEIPTDRWLIELTKVLLMHKCAVVTAPVHPKFPENTPRWLKELDLHNTVGKKDGDELRFTGTGNVLMDTAKINNISFNESYGKSGGSDTVFFLQITDDNQRILWAEKASLYETIPVERASLKYFLKRAMIQGRNYKNIMIERGEISSNSLFCIRAILVISISLPVASVLLIIRNKHAGRWLKRAFANIGFLLKPPKHLY